MVWVIDSECALINHRNTRAWEPNETGAMIKLTERTLHSVGSACMEASAPEDRASLLFLFLLQRGIDKVFNQSLWVTTRRCGGWGVVVWELPRGRSVLTLGSTFSRSLGNGHLRQQHVELVAFSL